MKKLTAFFLVSILALGAFSACAKTGDLVAESSGSEATASSISEASASSQTESSASSTSETSTSESATSETPTSESATIEVPVTVGIDEESLALIDRIITSDIEHGFSSAQLAVIKDGELVIEKAWGNIQTYDREENPVEAAPVTAETMYDLASNTKMYSVNYALQYLVTNGEADIDAKVVDILGPAFAEDTIQIEYEGRDVVELETNKKWKSELTLKDLLTHQAGFPPGPHYYNDRYDHATQDFDSDKGNVIYVGTGADAATREKTREAIFQTPLMYEPGTEGQYSDIDYIVLGFCVEEITGKRMDEFLEETFWEPLGLERICYNPLENGFAKEDCAATELMGNTRAGRLHYSGIRKDLLQGEVHDPLAYYCMDGVAGHAGMFASATDLAKLASLMLTGSAGDKTFFSKDVIELFTTPGSELTPEYGLGWWRKGGGNWKRYFGQGSSPEAVGHQGFTGTLTMIDPEENLVVVFLTNKIHSPMKPNDETLGKYNGNYYTTGMLGFVPELLYLGMQDADEGVDYLALVNKLNKLPEGWEEKVRTVRTTNSVEEDVEVEARAYGAYLDMKEELEKEGVFVDLDSARRSVATQQEIMDSFIEEYGADYAAKTVATPGYSEHHTGLALDLYLIIDGEDVVENEDMIQYPAIWEKIHAKLAEHGFILRYLPDKEHITGYGYEPWHIRYVNDPAIAKEITDKGLTLEGYLGTVNETEVEIDYGTSEVFTSEELEEAFVQVKCNFAAWEGCELHSLCYAGDEENSEKNIQWLSEVDEGAEYVKVAKIVGSFHSPVEGGGAWKPDAEYEDYSWWLSQDAEGSWGIVTHGYGEV